jgi:tRNA nucleotidyltransferase (CCA-adding enzyme)
MSIDVIMPMAENAKRRGWIVMVVGGYVRDLLMDKQSKDIDLEFYGPNATELEEFLTESDIVFKSVGKSFGVYKVKIEDQEVDIAIPRRENKIGQGHRGFQVEPDPTLTPMEAAQRRDFTMNAIAMDVLTGEIHNYNGGVSDIEDKVLKHTGDKFIEDPLRVLRGFQFAGRFDLTVDEKTAQLCSQLLPEYTSLSKERIWAEWEKWSEKAEKPSAGLRLLEKTGWLTLYPELHDLIGLAQDKEWHPEGDVFEHTCQTCDAMARLCTEGGREGRDRTVLMLAALCHDVGKAVTSEVTDQGRIISRGHPEAGDEIATMFLKGIGAPQDVTERVVPLVRNHMMHLSEHSQKSVRRLAVRLGKATITELAYVIKSDSQGRGSLSDREVPGLSDMMEIAKEVRVQISAPEAVLKGRHLMDLGVEPGPSMGKVLKNAYQAQLDGHFSTETTAIEWARENKSSL